MTRKEQLEARERADLVSRYGDIGIRVFDDTVKALMAAQIECEHCGRTFFAGYQWPVRRKYRRRADAKFCSDACRVKFNSRRARHA